MPKCSKYHAKWQVLVPNCYKYKANGTRKESQKQFQNMRQKEYQKLFYTLSSWMSSYIAGWIGRFLPSQQLYRLGSLWACGGGRGHTEGTCEVWSPGVWDVRFQGFWLVIGFGLFLFGGLFWLVSGFAPWAPWPIWNCMTLGAIGSYWIQYTFW